MKADPKEGGNATSPLHSRGSPIKGDKITAGPKEGGNATSPVHSPVSPTKGDKITASPKESGNATSPLHSRRSPTKGDKIKAGPKEGGNATQPARSPGSQQEGTRSKVATSPCLLKCPGLGEMATGPMCSRGSPEGGTKSEMVASPLPSRRAASRWNCYLIPVLSEVPGRGIKITSGYITHHPHIRGPLGGMASYPLRCGKSRAEGAKSEGDWAAHTWAELLCNTSLLGGHQKKGTNKNWLCYGCLLGGPQLGAIVMQPLRSRGPGKRGQIQKWLHHPCFLRGPQGGRIAT